jgi:hypothetical protein
MLSKCANPECSEMLRYLHVGKIFYLAPTPEIQIEMGLQHPALHERFWLCARCSKEMTLVWGGTKVRLVRLPARVAVLPLPMERKLAIEGRRSRTRAASAGREDC